jgi:hypothetical protein
MRDRAHVLLHVQELGELGPARTMSRAGPNELPATSIVGARIRNSPVGRQLRKSRVSISPAAKVDFAFFLAIASRDCRISRRPLSASYEPKTARAKSNDQGRATWPKVGRPATSTRQSPSKIRIAAAASPENSGGQGINERPATMRACQSGSAVVQ